MALHATQRNLTNVWFPSGISNFKAQAEIVDRRAHDERLFREIGSSKPKRTFKFDPTKSQQLLKKWYFIGNGLYFLRSIANTFPMIQSVSPTQPTHCLDRQEDIESFIAYSLKSVSSHDWFIVTPVKSQDKYNRFCTLHVIGGRHKELSGMHAKVRFRMCEARGLRFRDPWFHFDILLILHKCCWSKR